MVGPTSGLMSTNGALTSCYKYWWANLIYINNYVPGGETNMVSTQGTLGFICFKILWRDIKMNKIRWKLIL